MAAEPFDEDAFRAELEAKLKRLHYRRLTGDGKTFHEILTDAGVLTVLLESSMLRQLWKCILPKKIAQLDRQLEDENKAVDGQALRFHIKQAKPDRHILF